MSQYCSNCAMKDDVLIYIVGIRMKNIKGELRYFEHRLVVVADGSGRVFHKLLLWRKITPWRQGSEVNIGRLVGDHGKGTVTEIASASYVSMPAVSKCTTRPTLKISSIFTTTKRPKLSTLTCMTTHPSQACRKSSKTSLKILQITEYWCSAQDKDDITQLCVESTEKTENWTKLSVAGFKKK